MHHQHFLDLVRIHVEARHEDHVLLAIDEADEAALVHHADVAGAEPAVGVDHLGGLVGALPVAAHHLRAAHAQLARLADGGPGAVLAAKAHEGRWRGQADRTAERGHVVQIHGVHRDDRRALGEAVAFDYRPARHLLEALGDRALHRHPARHRELELREVALAEFLVVEECVVQRVDAGDARERLVADDLHHHLHVARVRDQDVAPAEPHEDERVHRQRIDVIERQRREHGFDVARHLVGDPRLRLQQVRDQVAVREHRAFRDAGRAAGVLQEREIVARGLHRLRRAARAEREGGAQPDRLRQVVVRHELLHVLQHEIDQASFRVETVGEQVAERGDDDVLHLRFRQRVLQRAREVLEHDDRLRAAVLQLVREFARGVERIHVDDDRAGLQRAEQRDRILERVRQHDRDAVAGLHAEALQIRRECVDLLRERAIGHRRAGADIRDAVGEAGRAFVEELHERRVLRDVDLVRDAGRVRRVPDGVGVRRKLGRGGCCG